LPSRFKIGHRSRMKIVVSPKVIMKQCLLKVSVAGLAIYATHCQIRLDAATVAWTNTSGGSWSVAANWTPNQVPGSSDDALITAGGTYSVTLDTSPAINSFTLGGTSGQQTLNTSGNSLTAGNPSAVNGNGVLGLNGGSLTGVVGVVGAMIWTGGNVYGSLTLGTNGLLVAGQGSGVYLYGVLTNAGTIQVTNTSGFELHNCGAGGGELVNLPGALVDIRTDASIYRVCGDEVFINQGTVRKSGGTGTSAINTVFDNTGTLDVESGTVALAFGGALGGIGTVAGGAGLAFNGGNFTNNDFNLSAGPGAHLEFGGGTFSGGPLDLGGTAANVAIGSGTVAVNGTLTNVTLSGGSLTGAVSVVGGMIWTSGDVYGSLTLGTNGVLVVGQGGGMYLYGVLTNAGTIQVTNTSGLALHNCGGGGGELVNLPGALVDIRTDASIYRVCGDEVFINQGTVRKSGGTGTTAINTVFNNTGTLDVESGTVALTFGGVLGGIGTVAGGAGLAFNGGNFTNNDFNLSAGAGAQLEFGGGTFSGSPLDLV
jgi:hypothetical protein